jgi:gamma-glutamyltranspeptidase/glutathione hydrolase
LGVLENHDFSALGFGPGPEDVDTVHLFTQAARLAFADCNEHVGDANFIAVPVEGLLDEACLRERAGLIDVAVDMGTAVPGNLPGGTLDPRQGTPNQVLRIWRQPGEHRRSAWQCNVICTLTTSVDSCFGSGLMMRGFLLNDQIADFSFDPVDASSTPIENGGQPSKRPAAPCCPLLS